MPECDNHDEQPVIFNGVDNTVVAYSNAKAIATAKSRHTRWLGINRQERDRSANKRLIFSIHALQRAQCSRSDLDLIRQRFQVTIQDLS